MANTSKLTKDFVKAGNKYEKNPTAENKRIFLALSKAYNSGMAIQKREENQRLFEQSQLPRNTSGPRRSNLTPGLRIQDAAVDRGVVADAEGRPQISNTPWSVYDQYGINSKGQLPQQESLGVDPTTRAYLRPEHNFNRIGDYFRAENGVPVPQRSATGEPISNEAYDLVASEPETVLAPQEADILSVEGEDAAIWDRFVADQENALTANTENRKLDLLLKYGPHHYKFDGPDANYPQSDIHRLALKEEAQRRSNPDFVPLKQDPGNSEQYYAAKVTEEKRKAALSKQLGGQVDPRYASDDRVLPISVEGQSSAIIPDQTVASPIPVPVGTNVFDPNKYYSGISNSPMMSPAPLGGGPGAPVGPQSFMPAPVITPTPKPTGGGGGRTTPTAAPMLPVPSPVEREAQVAQQAQMAKQAYYEQQMANRFNPFGTGSGYEDLQQAYYGGR